jgi:hypothetical protein
LATRLTILTEWLRCVLASIGITNES